MTSTTTTDHSMFSIDKKARKKWERKAKRDRIMNFNAIETNETGVKWCAREGALCTKQFNSDGEYHRHWNSAQSLLLFHSVSCTNTFERICMCVFVCMVEWGVTNWRVDFMIFHWNITAVSRTLKPQIIHSLAHNGKSIFHVHSIWISFKRISVWMNTDKRDEKLKFLWK